VVQRDETDVLRMESCGWQDFSKGGTRICSQDLHTKDILCGILCGGGCL
jgi:hypothetical protein